MAAKKAAKKAPAKRFPAKKAAKKAATKVLTNPVLRKFPAKKAAVKAVAKPATRKFALKKVARKAAHVSVVLTLEQSHDASPITAPLAKDLGDYPVFNAYRNLLCDHFGQVNLFEMGAMRDTPTDVAMADLFVRPALLTQHINAADATPETLAEGRDLLDVLAGTRDLVILGDPGAGKSTLVNWLSYALVNPRLKAVHQALGNLLPLPIILRDVFHSSPPSSDTEATASALLELFLTQPFASPLKPENGGKKLLQLALAERRAFLLLDGIDELPDQQRHWLRRAYHDFSREYSCRSLLTSRVIGYDTCPFHQREEWLEGVVQVGFPESDSFEIQTRISLKDREELRKRNWFDEGIHRLRPVHSTGTVLVTTPVFYTAPFDDARLEEFARRWYKLRSHSASKATDTADDFLAALQKSPSTHDLRRSPILLTYMAIVFRAGGHLPDGRSDLYAKIAEAYLETIPTRRKLTIPCHRQDAGVWLAFIAFRLQLRRTVGSEKPLRNKESPSAILIPEADLLALLAEAMAAYPPSPVDPEHEQETTLTPEELLTYLSQRAGLLLPRGTQDGGEAYAFTHLSFQEYFAAQYLNGSFTSYKEIHDAGRMPPEIALPALRSYIRDPRWAETVLLLFEILSLTSGPAIHPATLAGYLYAPENQDKPELNWYIHATYGKSGLSITGESKQALVLLCNLLNDAYIRLAPLNEPPHHHLLHALADATVTGEKKNTFYLGDSALQAFLSLKPCPAGSSLLGIISQAILRTGSLSLDLAATQVSDLTALKSLTSLESLNLNGTQVSDLTALNSLTSLESLNLNGTQVSDLTPLKSLTSLESLNLNGTQVSDLTPLKSLTRLQKLSLSDTQVSDLTALKSLANLESLDLSDTQVSDLTALKSLTSLQALNLGDTQVSDISALKGLTNLQELSLYGTQVSDLAALKSLTRLQKLSLMGTQVSDVTALNSLTCLEMLDLDDTQVRDVTGFKSLTSLRSLYLSRTQVRNVTALKSLTSLRFLTLNGAPLRDVSALKSLTNLQRLSLSETPASQNNSMMTALDEALPNILIHV